MRMRGPPRALDFFSSVKGWLPRSALPCSRDYGISLSRPKASIYEGHGTTHAGLLMGVAARWDNSMTRLEFFMVISSPEYDFNHTPNWLGARMPVPAGRGGGVPPHSDRDCHLPGFFESERHRKTLAVFQWRLQIQHHHVQAAGLQHG